MLSRLLLATCLLSAFVVTAKTPQEWKQSRVVYQILVDRFGFPNGKVAGPCNDYSNFCGGTFDGITDRLDYIAGMGFNAIWISPVVQNSARGYHGYWASNWTAISQEWGGEEGLKRLVDECHKRDIWVMVDVVANHVGNVGIQNINQIYPLNKYEYYHDCSGCPGDCNINVWDGSYIEEHCRLINLPDLNQDHPEVRTFLKNWVKSLVQTFDLDGIRVDTVPMVKRQFWREFNDAAGVYAVGEVFSGDVGMCASYMGSGSLDAVLSYPLYQTMVSVFAYKNSMWNLHNVMDAYSKFSDRSILGTFLDNHDNRRFLRHNSDWNLLKNALTLTLLAEGVPIMYYGTEQAYAGADDPQNREPLWYSGYKTDHQLYQFVKTLNNFRRQAKLGGTWQAEKWVQDWVYVYNRGGIALVVTTNSYDTHTWRVTNVGFSDNTRLCNLFNPSDCVTVQGNAVELTISGCQPKVYHIPLFDA